MEPEEKMVFKRVGVWFAFKNTLYGIAVFSRPIWALSLSLVYTLWKFALAIFGLSMNLATQIIMSLALLAFGVITLALMIVSAPFGYSTNFFQVQEKLFMRLLKPELGFLKNLL